MKFFAAVAAIALVRAQDEWESDPCDCLGYDNLPTYLFEESGFTDEYGSYCYSWDAGQNPDCFEGAEYEFEDWCSWDFNWCYVEETCIWGQHTIYYTDAKLYWKDCARDDMMDDMEDWEDEWDEDWDGDSATKMVATVATAFAVASLAM